MSEGTRCMWMRGGSSKGAYFLAADLPADRDARDALLLAVMGSPDPRQIDGIGGADPLTSKVAVVSPSPDAAADVDYLFLQVFVDRPIVTDAQGCGNILAGVGPFAVERGLVPARDGVTPVRIRMLNTGEIATAAVPTPRGRVRYDGDAAIAGVPGTAAPIPLTFEGVAGSTCGALLPTGRACDEIDGLAVTLIDGGMPCVILRAADLGLTGYEAPRALEENAALRARIEAIRLAAGPMMNLGNVAASSVPKMVLAAPPQGEAAISTRCFIPHRCHSAIGVFAAIGVATACLLPGAPVAALARPGSGRSRLLAVEHPTGATEVLLETDDTGAVVRSGTLRTARKLFDGLVFPAVR